jgi:hypothetical protein
MSTIQATQEVEVEGSQSEAGQGKSVRPDLRSKKRKDKVNGPSNRVLAQQTPGRV